MPRPQLGRSVRVTMRASRCSLQTVTRRRGWASTLPGRCAVVVLGMSGTKRRLPPVVVGTPRTAPLTDEDRQRAVTALTAMIHEWWSDGRGRSADAGPDRGYGPTADDGR